MSNDTEIESQSARAGSLASSRGAAAPETLRAFADLGDLANEECDWPTAIRAWDHLIAHVAADDAAELQLLKSAALRGKGARRLTAEPAVARDLFEQDLALHERLASPPGVLVSSVGNLASVLARLGEVGRAIELERRRIDLLVQLHGADHALVATAHRCLAELEQRR